MVLILPEILTPLQASTINVFEYYFKLGCINEVTAIILAICISRYMHRNQTNLSLAESKKQISKSVWTAGAILLGIPFLAAAVWMDIIVFLAPNTQSPFNVENTVCICYMAALSIAIFWMNLQFGKYVKDITLAVIFGGISIVIAWMLLIMIFGNL
jgi:hypothetical protein